MTVIQLPLFRRLPPPDQPPTKSRLWLPVSWRRAVGVLLRLRQLDLYLPRRRAPPNRVQWTLDASALPYPVRPSKVVWMIQTAPPQKPACFDSVAQWQEHLMLLHAEGTRITRRQDLGKHAKDRPRVVTEIFDVPRIDYCADCDIGGDRQRRMQLEQRCMPAAGPAPSAHRTPTPPPANWRNVGEASITISKDAQI